MSGFVFVLFVFFVIVGVLSNARKAGQGTGAPRRPGSTLPRTGQPYPRTPGDLPTPNRGESPPVLVAGSIPAEDRAEALVPDDLWAILTGERRPTVPPRPLQTPHEIRLPGNPPPAPVAEQARSSFEVAHRLAELPRERPAPAIVPTVTPSLAPAAGGAAAPAVAAAAPGSTAATAPGATAARQEHTRGQGLFAGPADLRRAFVAQLVLGPPKGLE